MVEVALVVVEVALVVVEVALVVVGLFSLVGDAGAGAAACDMIVVIVVCCLCLFVCCLFDKFIHKTNVIGTQRISCVFGRCVQ